MDDQWVFIKRIFALAEQICTVKSSDRSQINPKKYQFSNYTLPVTPLQFFEHKK